MASSLGFLLLLAGAAALLARALVVRSRDRSIARRVDLIARGPPRRAAAARWAAVPWQARVEHAARRLFALGMRRSWGITASSAVLLGAAVGGAVSLGLLARVALRWGLPAALVAAVAGFIVLPRLLLIREQHLARTRFAEMLPDAIDMVVRILRAGLPVGVAIRTVGEETDAPLNAVFAAIADQNEIGVPLEEALAKSSAAIGNADFRFLAVAVALQQSTGGNLALTLETLSEIIRKRRAVRQKARAASAEVRISALVLGAIPFFVTGALLLVAPDYLDPLFNDPRGNVILGLALGCLLAAGVTIRTMVRNALAG